MGYQKQAIIGFAWIAGLRGLFRGTTIVRLAILARILPNSPFQFGLYGIASLVVALIEIITETGINIFLVSEKKKIDEYINTAWVVSICRGIIIFSIIFLSAPLIARFFNSEASLYLLRLISIVPLIRGFINPSIVIFQKELKFHQEFYFRGILMVVESVAIIIIAFITKSISSVVIGLIISAALEVVLSFTFVRPRPRIKFEKDKLKRILHHGKWVTAAGIFNYLYHNGDNIVVGRMLGIVPLAYYDNAYKISMSPITEISDAVSRVTFPVYAKLSDDPARLRNALFRTLLVVTVLTLPLGLIFFFFPSIIITLIFGEKWLPAAPVLQVLAIFGVARAISGTPAALFYAIGKQSYVTSINFVCFLVLAITIIPFVNIFGLLGAGYAAIVATFAAIPPVVYYLRKVI